MKDPWKGRHMLVKELIAQLMECDPNMEVVMTRILESGSDRAVEVFRPTKIRPFNDIKPQVSIHLYHKSMKVGYDKQRYLESKDG